MTGAGIVSPAPDLVSGCLAVIQRLLTAATRRKSWHSHKAALTAYLHANIPHNLRQRLQERVLADWRVYDTVTLRLLELLFSSATSSLELIHVRTFYRDAFVNLLPRLTGLSHLQIQDPVWTLSRRQLGVTLLSISKMSYLRVLTLQYCGHDALLAAAGASCPHLQVVDVMGARGVTDEGVWSLVTVRPGGWSGMMALEEDIIKKKSMAVRLGKCWGAAVKSITSKLLFALMEPKDPKLLKHMRSDGEDSFCWSRCTSSLVHIDLRCTKASPVGVAILKQALLTKAQIEHDSFCD
ncbi:uncharacterized protein LOC135214401 [Macrobrachium nipponense]|uniref:uncharacterized protein LOC135214401 n=1 Tax=Macrobrachium nipponense TaxID=159736 RepID=UPI0030C80BBE